MSFGRFGQMGVGFSRMGSGGFVPGPSAGSGLLLEGDMATDPTDFLLLEGDMADDASDFLLLEGDMA